MISLREMEKLVKIVRRHHSVVAGAVSWSVIFAGFVSFFVLRFNLNIFGYSWEIAIGAILIATLVILYKIYIWCKNALIITSQRIVLNIRHGIFSRTVTELLYRDVYDISFKQSGLAALMNRYGTLMIKTPSGSEIIFDKVPLSSEVVKVINEIRSDDRPRQEHGMV